MDDLEFRRNAYANPSDTENISIEKNSMSEDNHQFIDELLHLDEKLKQAINIEPPEGLAERIILNQTLNSHNHVKRNRQLAFSVAASIVFFMGVFNYIFQPMPRINLQEEVFTHIYEEIDHLSESHNKNITQVNNALAQFGGKFIQEIGEINYLGTCNIAQKNGVHIILAGNLGSITVLMLPQIKVNTEQSISDGRFYGTIIPSNNGSIAIVGEKGESLKRIKQQLKNDLNWFI